MLLCNLPESVDLNGKNVTIRVLVDDSSYVASSLQFLYEDPQMLLTLVPSLGPTHGRTVVSIFGTAFDNSTKFFFDSEECSRTVLVSSSLSKCTIPAHAEGLSVVHADTGATNLKTNLSFFFRTETAVKMLLPSRGFHGILNIISVVGAFFSEGTVCTIQPTYLVGSHFVTSSHLRCILPAELKEGQYLLKVFSYWENAPLSGIDYFVHQAPEIKSFIPSRLSVSSQLLTVLGESFPAEENYLCRYGQAKTFVPAQWLSSSMVLCAPLSRSSFQIDSLINVTVNINIGLQVLAPNLFLSLIPESFITGIWPTSGPVDGDRNLCISAINTSSDLSGYECIFGSHSVPMSSSRNSTAYCSTLYSNGTNEHYAHQSWFICPLPLHRAGRVPLIIKHLSGKVLPSAVRLEFLFVRSLMNAVLQPSFGPINGGTVTTFSLESKDNISSFFCTFRQSSERSSILVEFSIPCLESVAINQISCPTPAMDVGISTVSLHTVESADVKYAEAAFSYVEPIVLHWLKPSSGSFLTNTLLTIYGEHFLNSGTLFCSFSGNVSKGLFLSISTVVCRLPHTNLDLLYVRVSNNAFDFEDPPLTFLITMKPSLFYLEPSVSSISGGFIVTAVGSNFASGSSGYGLFGKLKVVVKFVSKSTGLLIVPSGKEGVQSVQISNDGSEFSQALNFQYVLMPFITGVYPSYATHGESTAITVFGNKFESLHVNCRFENTIFAVATLISSSALKCLTPASILHVPRALFLSISYNIVENSLNLVPIYFFVAASLLRIVPSVGPSYSSFMITIFGSHFVSSTSFIVSFAQNRSQVPQFISSTKLVCSTPDNTVEGNVSIELWNFGVRISKLQQRAAIWFQLNASKIKNPIIPEVSSTNMTVQYYSFAVEIYSVYPSAVPCGMTNILTIQGLNFMRHHGVQCRVGRGDSVTVRVISDSIVECPVQIPREGVYAFTLSFNGTEQYAYGSIVASEPFTVKEINSFLLVYLFFL